MTLGACTALMSPNLLHAQFGGGGGGGRGMDASTQANFRDDQDIAKRRNAVPYFGATSGKDISEVIIAGNKLIPQQQIMSMIRSRSGRVYDPEEVQMDVRKLVGSGLFRDVRTFRRDTPGGVSLTYEVFERPVVSHVHFVGNESIKDRTLLKEVGIKPGDPMNRFAIDEASRRLTDHYRGKGYAKAYIEPIESVEGPSGVAFRINEGPQQKVRSISFKGNKFVSGARLKAGAKVQSKPGILWVFGGKVNYDQVDEDIDRLYAYYRSFGYFRCRVGRELSYDANEEWVDVKFTIDEGPRYRVRSINFNGNQQFPQTKLAQELETKTSEYFNLVAMQRDMTSLRDLYGSQGYVFNKIEPELKFDREPGVIDLVFNVDEGDQFRVGRILVNIDGEQTHTRNSVVLNRLSIRPGDLIDVQKIRASERRLQSSQLFKADPAQGIMPKIAVKPSEDRTQIANAPTDTFRGQSQPTESRFRRLITRRPIRPAIRYADIVITVSLADSTPENTNASIDGGQIAGPSESDNLDDTPDGGDAKGASR